MALTNAFYEAVNSGNIRRVRIMMKDSLLIDPTFKEFGEMDKIAGSMKELYDVHDGGIFIPEKAKWDDDYMNRLMVQVIGNFSHKRVDHLKEVVRYLRPISNTGRNDRISGNEYNDTGDENTNYSYQGQKHRDQKNGTYIEAKATAGAAVGALVGGTAAYAAGISVVGGVVTGAVLGGVIGYVIGSGGC